MTTERRDGGGTQFSNWLRMQPEIDSVNNKFFATDIDYVWVSRQKQLYMIIEEKRKNALPKVCQRRVFQNLHNKCLKDIRYHGFYYLIFERTTPDDGAIYISSDIMSLSDQLEITKNELIRFLRFEYNPLKRGAI
jgi:hypothetical protein